MTWPPSNWVLDLPPSSFCSIFGNNCNVCQLKGQSFKIQGHFWIQQTTMKMKEGQCALLNFTTCTEVLLFVDFLKWHRTVAIENDQQPAPWYFKLLTLPYQVALSLYQCKLMFLEFGKFFFSHPHTFTQSQSSVKSLLLVWSLCAVEVINVHSNISVLLVCYFLLYSIGDCTQFCMKKWSYITRVGIARLLTAQT